MAATMAGKAARRRVTTLCASPVSGVESAAMSGRRKQRLLVFVIAYYADSTLKRVLDRIPPAIFDEYDCEVLVVDDASEDRTFEIGREYKRTRPDIRMTVLRNQFNQGYGGNQKVGYAFAIEEQFDFVAMVHGDGQYAPEALPLLLAPLRDGEGDAVFGSRMMQRIAALQGGMPLYKYVGNRILTELQNAMLGTKLSEFHSGYRIYSVKTLASIPYRLNSNDFHFDTEIIIQLLNAGARIVERPIPTYYGNEICRVNGMKYAKDVLQATWANVMHRSGIFYQRRYDTVATGNRHYDLKLGFASSHTMALEAVPAGARVLDIGGGPGGIASELTKKGCQVAVVDQFATAAVTRGIEAHVQSLDDELTFATDEFDYLLLLDIIEHLRAPEQFLTRLRALFDYRTKKLVLTTPNIAFIVQRLLLLAGQFNYGKAGILDLTHTRLLTFRSTEQLLRDAGFRIKKIRGVPAPFPKVLGNGILGKAAVALNQALLRVSKTLFAYQIYVEAESTPDVDFILRDTKRRSDDAVPIKMKA
jgi:glycosyltransferase involved in cell wall biosynthesis